MSYSKVRKLRQLAVTNRNVQLTSTVRKTASQTDTEFIQTVEKYVVGQTLVIGEDMSIMSRRASIL